MSRNKLLELLGVFMPGVIVGLYVIAVAWINTSALLPGFTAKDMAVLSSVALGLSCIVTVVLARSFVDSMRNTEEALRLLGEMKKELERAKMQQGASDDLET